VDQLGPNALGEVLEPGRVRDCYLGLLLPPGPAGEPEAGTVLVIAPAGLLHPRVPQPDGSLVYGAAHLPQGSRSSNWQAPPWSCWVAWADARL
jgi:hypothetical protein